jgi:hypothetical protein
VARLRSLVDYWSGPEMARATCRRSSREQLKDLSARFFQITTAQDRHVAACVYYG